MAERANDGKINTARRSEAHADLAAVMLFSGLLTLITQRPLPGAPLEALNDAVFDRAQQRLVHLRQKYRKTHTQSFSYRTAASRSPVMATDNNQRSSGISSSSSSTVHNSEKFPEALL